MITSRPNYGEAIAKILDGKVVATDQFNRFLDDLMSSASSGESSADGQAQASSSVAELQSIAEKSVEAIGAVTAKTGRIDQILEQQARAMQVMAQVNQLLFQRINDLEQKLDGYKTFPG